MNQFVLFFIIIGFAVVPPSRQGLADPNVNLPPPMPGDFCKSTKAVNPAIRVEVIANEAKLDHSMSRENLRRFDVTTESPYGPNAKVHVNGLMRGAITVDSNLSMAWQSDKMGRHNCFWIQNMTLTLRLDPTIYIAREIPKGTCLYREVLGHEFKHYDVDVAIAKDYQVLFQDDLQRALADIGVVGPYPARQRLEAQKALAAAIEKRIQVIYDRLKDDRLKRQAQVDTRAEYDRVARACPGETGLM